MELLPYKDENGDTHFENEFCDYKCKEAWVKWSRFFVEDRIKAETVATMAEFSTDRTSRKLDLSL